MLTMLQKLDPQRQTIIRTTGVNRQLSVRHFTGEQVIWGQVMRVIANVTER